MSDLEQFSDEDGLEVVDLESSEHDATDSDDDATERPTTRRRSTRVAPPLPPLDEGAAVCPHSTATRDPRTCSQCAGVALDAERRFRAPAAGARGLASAEAKRLQTCRAGGAANAAKRKAAAARRAASTAAGLPILDAIPATMTTVQAIAERIDRARNGTDAALRRAGVKPVAVFAMSGRDQNLFDSAVIEQWVATRKSRPRRRRITSRKPRAGAQ